MLDLEDLRTFVEAATQGTFTAAASGLYTSQPSLSRRIARLERQLGGVLFDRSNRRSPRLAPLGEALLPYARELLAEHQRFVTIAQEKSDGPSGTLSIALSAVTGAPAIPVLCGIMADHLPGARMKILERTEGIGVREALLHREAELGLLAPAFMSAELAGLTFGVTEHQAVGLASVIGRRDAPIEWEELKQLPLLLPMAATEMRYPHHENLRIVHEDGAPEVLLAMARAGASEL